MEHDLDDPLRTADATAAYKRARNFRPSATRACSPRGEGAPFLCDYLASPLAEGERMKVRGCVDHPLRTADPTATRKHFIAGHRFVFS
jgi:hypothetical protein